MRKLRIVVMAENLTVLNCSVWGSVAGGFTIHVSSVGLLWFEFNFLWVAVCK